ncbi:FtsX-like permease family protein [Zunongwangia endophytica]|uniref:FtsX-like permease family protein n=1 Tax=Zunongwangia endophytica TaxID=1808945 RepID=A0ABV8H6M4_9FLAO|nr:FtsX-like permease family protein [Zunongwangia endophytica]MDN3595999.1 ABC transporter permease [Zunongwangia endophytica]
MLRNYIKIAFRNLWKDKTFTVLNLVGLSTAFAVAVLLGVYAFFELSYDSFHKNKASLYQVYNTNQTPEGIVADTPQSVPFAPALREEVPGLAKISRYNGKGVLVISGDKELRMSAAYVDPDFFSMFSFPILKGKEQKPTADKSTISITEHAANRIYGDENPLGKTLRIITEGEEKLFTVSALIEDFPDQSSLKFDLALDFSNQASYSYADIKDDWSKENHEVYAQLEQGVTAAQFEKATEPFTQLHYQEEMDNAKRDGAQPDENGLYKQIRLLPFEDVSYANFDSGIARIEKTMPYLVLGVGFLILFIACVNFINMSIAKSSQRLREIGMRKTLGAGNGQLFFQFWGESVLIFLGAAIFGGLLAFSLTDSFKTLFSTRATFEAILSFKILVGSVVSFLLITFIAGGYPALLLSKLGTLQSLKGKLNLTRKNSTRDFLMVVQFGIAILLISGTFILWQQIDFMRNKNLGYNKEQVISLPLNGKLSGSQAVERLRNKLQNHPEIISISSADNILGLGKDGGQMTSQLGFDYKGRGVSTHRLTIGYDYVETLDLKLIEGRSFDRSFSTDSLGVLINQKMAAQLQEENPLETRFILGDSTYYQVLGVLEDYNFQKLNQEVEPLSIFLEPDSNKYYAYIKVAPNKAASALTLLEKTWKDIEPNANFLGSFLDENIDRTFKAEKKMATMITSGSILAIILSCIGLFAISLLIVAQRRKEIGVRKVIGASVLNLTLMLSKDFLKLVGVSFLIAAPVSWWLANNWLQKYANHINLTFWIFVAAGVTALFIALITISLRTINAALQNPVKSLRTE